MAIIERPYMGKILNNLQRKSWKSVSCTSRFHASLCSCVIGNAIVSWSVTRRNLLKAIGLRLLSRVAPAALWWGTFVQPWTCGQRNSCGYWTGSGLTFTKRPERFKHSWMQLHTLLDQRNFWCEVWAWRYTIWAICSDRLTDRPLL